VIVKVHTYHQAFKTTTFSEFMSSFPIPSEENEYLASHVRILRNSYRHWKKQEFVNPRLSDRDAARYVFYAPFAVLSHDASQDPIFNYANETALKLLGLTWVEMTTFPSRLSAERQNQGERQQLLDEVTAKGYIDGYQGVRIGRHGRKFAIENATVWNLLNSRGHYCGQAATFSHWNFL
jgi:hypothetical protein